MGGAAMPVSECLDSQERCSVPYRIRTSARARNVRLQLAADGLTVVVPLHFNLCRIPRSWSGRGPGSRPT